MRVRTEDGVEVGIGDLCYDYYTMKPGAIERFDDDERVDVYHSSLMQGSTFPWFRFRHTDGTCTYLNGQRICSRERALIERFPNA
jgi:hypothetical protein